MGYFFHFSSLYPATHIEFVYVLAYLNFIFKAFLALPKTASSAQTHKSVSSFELFGALYMYIAVSSTKAFTESK